MADSKEIEKAHNQITKMYDDKEINTDDLTALFKDNDAYREILGSILDRKNETKEEK